MDTGHIASTQTLCLKGVPKAHARSVLAAVQRHTRPTLGLCDAPDREPGCGGDVLIYANYKSGRDAQTAREDMAAWVRDKWAEAWGPRPQVLLKSELQDPYFAVYVDGFAPGTQPREIDALFAKFGRLHPTRVCAIKNSDNAFFVNYADYEGAAAALAAARGGALRFKAAILRANGARNTTFLSALIAEARSCGFSFSLDDAKRVAKRMDEREWPPQESSIERLIKAAPQRFVLDRQTKQFHLMDAEAPLAPAQASAEPPRTRTPSPPRPRPALSAEERRAMPQRKAIVDRLLHDSFEQPHELFVSLWFQVKGEEWVDSNGMASCSAEELMVELNRSELPPQMLKPVADWDLPSLLTALTATSLKAKLQTVGTGARSASRRERDPTSARWMVLVEEGIVSEEDLVQKYGSTFTTSCDNAFQAVKTVRIVRNLLCHMKGSAVGLSQPSFECLWGLASEALNVLASALGGDHPARLAARGAALLASLGEHAGSPVGSQVGSPRRSGAASRHLPGDDSLSVCSAAPTELCEAEPAGIESWGVEQVLEFFERCKFPTEGIRAGQVDGGSLLELYQDADAQSLFMAPAPDGLGFNKLMFKGRFKKEMDKLVAATHA